MVEKNIRYTFDEETSTWYAFCVEEPEAKYYGATYQEAVGILIEAVTQNQSVTIDSMMAVKVKSVEPLNVIYAVSKDGFTSWAKEFPNQKYMGKTFSEAVGLMALNNLGVPIMTITRES